MKHNLLDMIQFVDLPSKKTWTNQLQAWKIKRAWHIWR